MGQFIHGEWVTCYATVIFGIGILMEVFSVSTSRSDRAEPYPAEVADGTTVAEHPTRV